MISGPFDRWYNDTEESNLQQQLAALSLLPKTQPAPNELSTVSAADRRPISLRMGSRSRATLDSRAISNIPTLTTTSSRSSISTVRTSDANIEIAPRLEDNGDGLDHDTESHPQRIFGCPFYFMECHLAYSSYEDWVSHSLSHFHRFAPPNHALCPFCNKTFDDADGNRCWEVRMRHVAGHHLAGFTTEEARPDFNLYRYLRGRGLINAEDYNHLCGYSEQPEHMRPRDRISTFAMAGPPNGYIVKNNPRRERRRRDG